MVDSHDQQGLDHPSETVDWDNRTCVQQREAHPEESWPEDRRTEESRRLGKLESS